MLINSLLNSKLNQKELVLEVTNRLTLKEAAKELGVSYWKIRDLISKGIIIDCLKVDQGMTGPKVTMVLKSEIRELSKEDRSKWLGKNHHENDHVLKSDRNMIEP